MFLNLRFRLLLDLFLFRHFSKHFLRNLNTLFFLHLKKHFRRGFFLFGSFFLKFLIIALHFFRASLWEATKVEKIKNEWKFPIFKAQNGIFYLFYFDGFPVLGSVLDQSATFVSTVRVDLEPRSSIAMSRFSDSYATGTHTRVSSCHLVGAVDCVFTMACVLDHHQQVITMSQSHNLDIEIEKPALNLRSGQAASPISLPLILNTCWGR